MCLIYILCTMIWSAIAMENDNGIVFSIDQRVCFNFFDQNPEIKDKAFKRVSLKDQNNYQLFAYYFFEEALRAHIDIPLECNAPLLAQTLLDMKKAIEQKSIQPIDTFTTRIYVFSQLTPFEQSLVSAENYQNNEDAHKILRRLGSEYAWKLRKLGEIQVSEYQQTAQSLTNKKIQELERYSNLKK